ncbi:MAG TPA: hypothetical protein V6D47_02385, partial [Oscillatoriaceae cyanobacterium]
SELPVKGILVAAVSLSTHELLAPAVYTDSSGRYTLAVPQSVQENYAIVAGFPGKDADDPVLKKPGLRYAMVAHPDGSGRMPLLDEDTDGLNYYVRNCMRPYMTQMLFAGDPGPAEDTMLQDWMGWGGELASSTPESNPFVSAMRSSVDSGVKTMRAELPTDGTLDDKGKQAEIGAWIDVALADSKLDPESVPINAYLQMTNDTDLGAGQQTAAQALEHALAFVRDEADKYPGTLASAEFQAMLIDTDTGKPFVDPLTNAPYTIHNGADLERFVMHALLTGGTSQPLLKTEHLMDLLAGSEDPIELALRKNDLQVGCMSFLLYVYQQAAAQQHLPPVPKGLVSFLN